MVWGFNFVVESPCLFGARFSVATVQLCRRIAFLGPGFQPPRLSFVVESPFWSQVFNHQGSGLSSNRLFGAVFSVGTVQLCRRIALPFWGQVFSRHGSTLSSNRFFGAVFSVATVQLCRRIALPFWGQVFSRHGSTFVVESPCLFGARFKMNGS
ncbi:MAG: hypothetical protein B6247_31640 [Candidatus Parabeggiatoa sp. nov. 2]|nr:MAG: hypothetical protein B6247_31640 [Beggiatoa sp. 4572_84]